MRYVVTCQKCTEKVGYPIKSEFPDKPGAEAYVRRHALTNHRAEITEVQQ
ncbi:hypothetical protein [Mycolicibacterium setense]|nr:hypothetical protein [Mycolicibacterium setense]